MKLKPRDSSRPPKPLRKTPTIEAPSLDTLKQINLNAAGMDIGDRSIYVCVPPGRDEQSVRVFPTFTADLNALADWLSQCGVTTVAMESTGVYWIAIFQILEARGFEVYLVNAAHIKNVPGKKTDILDCQWIQPGCLTQVSQMAEIRNVVSRVSGDVSGSQGSNSCIPMDCCRHRFVQTN